MTDRWPIGARGGVCAVLLTMMLAGCASSDTGSRSPAASGSAAGSAAGTAAASGDEDSDAPAESASAADCGTRTTPHPQLAARLPAGFPTVAGWSATEVVSQGQTRAVRGVVAGAAKNIAAVRDAAVARIIAAGYSRTGSDQEPGFEADADFNGPHQGNINVRALCRGFLVLTYTIQS
jgi:hypothetical protein